ncbi:MAG: sigma-54-dependent Fis family transcriptional regulator, partial [Moorellaceae bacterium]
MRPLESVRSSVLNKELFVSKPPISVIRELVRQERCAAERIRRLKLEVIYNHIEPSQIPWVPLEIVESWVRSKNYGHDPFRFKPRPVVGGLSWQNLLTRKRFLLDAADAYLERVVNTFGDGRWCIFLCDENGVILRVVSSRDKPMRKYNEKYQLVPGAVWTEMTGGTCAHGLCMILNKPIQLWGPEHYTEPGWGLVTCSAAPIFDFIGNLIGTLSLSTDSYLRRYSEGLGLVVSLAWAIQNRLENLGERDHYLYNIPEADRESAIIVNRRGIITRVGTQVGNILKKVWPEVPAELEGMPLAEVFGRQPLIDRVLQEGQQFHEVKLRLARREGPYLICSVWPIKDRFETINGCLVVVRTAEVERKSYAPSIKAIPAGTLPGDFTFDKIIIGKSPRLLEAIDIAKKAAYTGAGILLQGESGVGKDVFARCIHNLSRPSGPFVAVNCAALPKSLIESELFGYEGGAFT